MTDQPPQPPDETHPPPPPQGEGDSPSPPAPRGATPPPPPPGGVYPPPPPSAGGYVPPAPGPAVRGLPPQGYTSWFTRLLAFIIDLIPSAIIIGIGAVVLGGTWETTCLTDVSQYGINEVCATGPAAVGSTAFWLAVLVALGYLIWNYGYRQGTTGSSIGKSVTKFKVVSENTGQPIGFGLSVVRQLAHFVDAIVLCVGFLLPLWDVKRQTLGDKIMSTVCLPS
ncbi:MAG TPA: RDD family protein [Mycobacterium sp.]|nr:RDD family protein [Mycobacterium sp.]